MTTVWQFPRWYTWQLYDSIWHTHSTNV